MPWETGSPPSWSRPVGCPDLPGPASEEQRVRALVHRGDEPPGLLVGVRRQPSAALEPAASILVGTPGTLVHAVHGQEDHGGQLHGHRSLRVILETRVAMNRRRSAVARPFPRAAASARSRRSKWSDPTNRLHRSPTLCPGSASGAARRRFGHYIRYCNPGGRRSKSGLARTGEAVQAWAARPHRYGRTCPAVGPVPSGLLPNRKGVCAMTEKQEPMGDFAEGEEKTKVEPGTVHGGFRGRPGEDAPGRDRPAARRLRGGRGEGVA